MATSSAPTPRSPPKYPDMYGKHRKQAELQILNREIGFLEEELRSVEGLQPSSRFCKEVNDFVMTNPDPLISLNWKVRRSLCPWKWLRSKLCFNFSWICCFGRCTLRLEWPSCACDPVRYWRCCCQFFPCCDCCHCCHCRHCQFQVCRCQVCQCQMCQCQMCQCQVCRCQVCQCQVCQCCCSCLKKCSCTPCCVLPSLSCPDCSCSCTWSCPKCKKVCQCPKCTWNYCIPTCCLCF